MASSKGVKADNKKSWWRRHKRLLIAAAGAFGLYHIMAPDYRELDAGKSYEPNAIQQEFMRLAAQKYDYVALGDTNHTRLEIQMFATDAKTVRALADGGDKYFFMETAPEEQVKIEALRMGITHTYNQAGNSMWICSDKTKARVNENFSDSVRRNSDVSFVAADQRLADGNALNDSLQVELLIGVPLVIYAAVYGCVDTPAFVPGAIIGMFTGLHDKMGSAIEDDSKTANYILSFNHPPFVNGGTIFFGARHFEEETAEKSDVRMSSVFKKAGNSVAVINIYADESQQRSSHADTRNADAYLYVTPNADNPDGIYTNDPALKALYRQAKENIEKQADAVPLKIRP